MFYFRLLQNKRRVHSNTKPNLRLPEGKLSLTGFTPLETPISQPGKRKSLTGFTLMELMIGAAVLIVALTGLIAAFIGCFALNETGRNITIAINGCQEKLEEIHNESFGQIFAIYSVNPNFEVTGLDNAQSEGVVEVDNTDPDLLEITVTVCWRQKGRRMFGEDSDLDGVLDVGEDDNGNGQLDSPAQLVTLMAMR